MIEGRRHESGRTSTEDPRRTAVAGLGDPRHPLGVNRPARDPEDSLWRADRRALTLGLVLTITLVGFEALAISTVMPIVAEELGGLELYGWVFSAFFLGSLIGIVVVGGAIDRGGLAVPFAAGLGLFAIGLLAGGLAPTMPFLVAARFVQGLGAGTIQPIAYVAIGRTLPEHLRPRMFAVLSTAWVLPGVIGPAIAGTVGEVAGWRYVFLGLLPLIALAAALTLGALRNVADAPPVADEAARARRGRLPLAITVALGAGLLTVGLTSGEPIPTVVLSVAGILDRPLRAPEADPARHPRRPAGPAGGGPPPRDPHLHVLRGRRLRRADARRLARRVGDRSRHRADLGHHRLDRRGVDPGPRRHALADLAFRPGRLPGHPGRSGRDDRRAAIRT